ncbi:hypothetical protein GNZ12_35410 [Paraburkholderia sp. 1N]|uniref:Uncharacterized protein n=1 Tax=Paraburkholderia solitsugae TaxID=2675748 RepID=A0ABX2C0P1_9BURK|nr:hypothetical protein [Paraburkholderia solitsugae]NPT46514.1 hypothetical protein [Paraburkholderia solitsugae]
MKAKVVLTDCGRDSLDIEHRILGETADSRDALAVLQSGAPREVRRVLECQWSINFVNPAVCGENQAGL